MTTLLQVRNRGARRFAAPLASLALLAVFAGCAKSSSSSTTSTAAVPAPTSSNSPTGTTLGGANAKIVAPSPDPRVGLKGGLQDAASAIWNMKQLSHRPSPPGFETNTNSDLAFTGNTVLQGNYNGFVAWDISNPSAPTVKVANLCPSSQDDISVYGNLAFLSAESGANRLDCSAAGGRGTVVAGDGGGRILGVRIYDITDVSKPKYIGNVQTCRGSHTHTLVVDPNDKANVYIYISGTSGVRADLPGCVAAADDPNTALFRIEVIKVPLAHPEQAAIVSSPRIFADAKTGAMGGLVPARGHGAPPSDAPAAPAISAADQRRIDSVTASLQAVVKAKLKPLTARSTKADTTAYNKTADSLRQAGYPAQPIAAAGGRGGGARGLTQCHDITVYPGVGLAGGACAGMGLLLDIRDAAHPVRLDAVADTNFSYWHSATFSNDGSKVLFSDEWGGGGAAYCRSTDPKEWGGDAIFQIVKGKMVFKSYYKLSAPQTRFENCVAHNGSLIPIPGRDIMVQAFYQGGLTIFEWTDPSHPVELAYFDRGPNDSTRLVSGGFWSVYWYNGLIIGSEEKRGLDIFELTPSAAISQNEIDAAKTVVYHELNVQGQPKIVWPASFAMSKAFVDQLERNAGLPAARIASTRSAITAAQAMNGEMRKNALNKLAGDVAGFAGSSSDKQKVQMLSKSLTDLAAATP